MNDKEKRLQALYNLKSIYKNMIDTFATQQDGIYENQNEINEMLEFLSNIMKEIEQLENELKK